MTQPSISLLPWLFVHILWWMMVSSGVCLESWMNTHTAHATCVIRDFFKWSEFEWVLKLNNKRVWMMLNGCWQRRALQEVPKHSKAIFSKVRLQVYQHSKQYYFPIVPQMQCMSLPDLRALFVSILVWSGCGLVRVWFGQWIHMTLCTNGRV